MTNEWHELTPEEEQSRDSFLIDWHTDRIKQPHDFNWRQVAQITGDGDYLSQDEGMEMEPKLEE